MKKIFTILAVLALLLPVSAFAQGGVNSIVQTTLSAAANADADSVTVASATGITASPATLLYVVDVGQQRGEAMRVTAVSSTTITVTRGTDGTGRVAHLSGAMVLAGRPDWFYGRDPRGTCTAASTHANPWVNISSGNQWICSTVTGAWVPGYINNLATPQVTTAVASVAGTTNPSGPLFHITGTNAITAWGVPVGGVGRGFCVIPDAAYTTTATNNIAKASTAVANQLQCWAWDATNSKYVPTY